MKLITGGSSFLSRIVDVLGGTWDSGTTNVYIVGGRLVNNGKFTDSPVMNKTLEEYRMLGLKKKKKIQLCLPPFDDG